MIGNKSRTTAEIVDRFLLATAIGVFVMAVNYAAGAGMHLADTNTREILDTLQLILSLAVLVILLPIFMFSVGRLSRSQRRVCLQSEGFVAGNFRKAGASAFSATFIFLIAMDVVTGKYLLNLPTDFFIKVVLSLTLLVFSIRFFQLNREGGMDGLDE